LPKNRPLWRPSVLVPNQRDDLRGKMNVIVDGMADVFLEHLSANIREFYLCLVGLLAKKGKIVEDQVNATARFTLASPSITDCESTFGRYISEAGGRYCEEALEHLLSDTYKPENSIPSLCHFAVGLRYYAKYRNVIIATPSQVTTLAREILALDRVMRRSVACHLAFQAEAPFREKEASRINNVKAGKKREQTDKTHAKIKEGLAKLEDGEYTISGMANAIHGDLSKGHVEKVLRHQLPNAERDKNGRPKKHHISYVIKSFDKG